MVSGSMGILLELFSQFLCSLDELFGLFNFVGHYAFTPFTLRKADRCFLQTVADSSIHTLPADVRRAVRAGEGCIGREYRGIDCN